MVTRTQSGKVHAHRFRPLLESEAAGGAPIVGEVPLDQFTVLSPDVELNAERNAVLEADGAPLSRFGARLRATIAKLRAVSPEQVPLGVIRALEAASADDEHNIRQLAQTQISRTGSGTMYGALLRLHSPVVEPSMINGRILAQTQAAMAGEEHAPVVRAVDAEALRLPRLLVDSADQVRHQADEARRLLSLDLYKYKGSDDREFIDDLILKGVKEPPLVVPFHLDAGESGSGWLLKAVDGARRTTASQMILHSLTGRDARFAMRHWSDGKGNLEIRDMTATDVLLARRLLTFEESSLTGLFPMASGHTARDQERQDQWRQTIAVRSPAIRAAHRVRTYFAFVVLDVEAFGGATFPHPAWQVVNDAVRQRHMPRAAAKQWAANDVWTLYAIDLIEEFASRGIVDEVERAALLNPRAVDFADITPVSPERPYRNRLAAIAHLATLACTGDTVDITNQVLAENQERRHSHERGQIVGAQARLLLGLHADADGNSISSTITSMCKDKVFYRLDLHPGAMTWAHLIGGSPEDLLAGAIGDMVQRYVQKPADRAEVGPFGPHQRALGFLGGLALVTNPRLLELDEHLTRTGRGGRGGRASTIGRHEPAVLLRHMMSSDEGLRQLAEIVRATTLPVPRVPADADGALTETRLRTEFLPELGQSAKDVRFVPHEDTGLDPRVVWLMMSDQLEELVEGLTEHVAQMRGHEFDDRVVGPALELEGLPVEVVDPLKLKVNELAEFLADASAFWRIARRRTTSVGDPE
ncbi:hypothetical protein [Actinokineospora terrae]|uniref:Uncharacterized protein n=1 Tax=Actinokineospora terrae TaxID=155974 RepID=A0A1H9NWD4_9PSEU|nr:hypothetical protein [Actinokineospora terrae]SER40228.1 hypothetical protein SAMN04487818_103170 [Actinokineospora terrae]